MMGDTIFYNYILSYDDATMERYLPYLEKSYICAVNIGGRMFNEISVPR